MVWQHTAAELFRPPAKLLQLTTSIPGAILPGMFRRDGWPRTLCDFRPMVTICNVSATCTNYTNDP